MRYGVLREAENHLAAIDYKPEQDGRDSARV